VPSITHHAHFTPVAHKFPLSPLPSPLTSYPYLSALPLTSHLNTSTTYHLRVGSTRNLPAIMSELLSQIPHSFLIPPAIHSPTPCHHHLLQPKLLPLPSCATPTNALPPNRFLLSPPFLPPCSPCPSSPLTLSLLVSAAHPLPPFTHPITCATP